MITDEHIRGYIESLTEGLPDDLYELQQKALQKNVPIIRNDAISMLRFLLRAKRPSRILEIGTAVGFSALVMSEYARDAEIVTLEKVDMRLKDARRNLRSSERIVLLKGDANDTLRFLSGDGGTEPEEVYVKGKSYTFSEYREEYGSKMPYSVAIIPQIGNYDFCFMDAAKGQYMSFLEPVTKLLAPGALLITDNVLMEGRLAESRFSVERRDRTIHTRMREYLYHLTHCEEYETVILPIADGMSISVKKEV